MVVKRDIEIMQQGLAWYISTTKLLRYTRCGADVHDEFVRHTLNIEREYK